MESSQTSGPRTGVFALIEAMRLPHWVKNAFVLAPILFSGYFARPEAWAQCLLAMLSCCLLSSAVYLVNDVADRDADRAHPSKRQRPVASGRLGAGTAVAAAAVLAVAGLGLALLVDLVWYSPERALAGAGLLAWTSSYLVLNLLYSFWLKSHYIVDVIVVALGFVLRAMAGAAAINVAISPWLVVCTFTLTLFIALTKRRAEVLNLPVETSHGAREANRCYTSEVLDHMVTVATGLAILTYSLYCVAPATIHRLGSGHMIWTIPLVVYGLFRFNAITRRTPADPTAILLRDKIMWIVVAMYVAMVLAIIVLGPRVSGILETSWELKQFGK